VQEEREVALGLEDEHRHVDVLADDGISRRNDRRLWSLRERGDAEPPTAVDKEAVVDLRERVNRIHVLGELEGGLRLADSDHALWRERAERVRTGGRR